MSLKTDFDDKSACPQIGWKDGFFGLLAGSGAGLCCAGPLLFGSLGMYGVAGTLASLPFVYHVILQWIALTIMAGTWAWFGYKLSKQPPDQRWTIPTIVTGLILVAVTLYVLRSWATHILV